MAQNFRQLQETMDAAIRSENKQRVHDELQRMAAAELRNPNQLIEADPPEQAKDQ